MLQSKLYRLLQLLGAELRGGNIDAEADVVADAMPSLDLGRRSDQDMLADLVDHPGFLRGGNPLAGRDEDRILPPTCQRLEAGNRFGQQIDDGLVMHVDFSALDRTDESSFDVGAADGG